MPEITRYTAAQSAEWNEFVERSKNGTFLFHRSYMDYHADRFTDHSLMVWNKGRLSALLPANEHDGTLYSHQGLTYGGLITNQHTTTAFVCDTFEAINNYLAQQGITQVIYKAIPWPYHLLPAEEDLYAHRVTSFRSSQGISCRITSERERHRRFEELLASIIQQSPL